MEKYTDKLHTPHKNDLQTPLDIILNACLTYSTYNIPNSSKTKCYIKTHGRRNNDYTMHTPTTLNLNRSKRQQQITLGQSETNLIMHDARAHKINTIIL